MCGRILMRMLTQSHASSQRRDRSALRPLRDGRDRAQPAPAHEEHAVEDAVARCVCPQPAPRPRRRERRCYVGTIPFAVF
jgi:hypothetical protein